MDSGILFRIDSELMQRFKSSYLFQCGITRVTGSRKIDIDISIPLD